MKLLDVLNTKGRKVITAHPEDTVLDAVRTLVSNKVGALVVVDDRGKLAGIITERDILRLSGTECGNFSKMLLSEHMTRNLVVATGATSVEESLILMSEHRVRHLPVVDNGELGGLISQGDLVKAMLDDARHEAKQLAGFVTGQYPV
jgi:CBS domain-containing protein